MVAATVRTASTRTHHYAISFLLRVCLSIPLSSLLLFFCSSVSTFLVILLPFLQLSLFLATFSLSFLPLSFFHLQSRGHSALTAASRPAL